MRKLKDHINYLFKDFPNTEEVEAVKQDIIFNLEEKVSYLMEQGKSEEDAMNKAIVEFGDVEDLKAEFNLDQEPAPKKSYRLLNLQYSVLGSALIIALMLFINFYYTPHTIWFVYPTFGVLWWPLTMYFVWLRKSEGKR